MRYSVAKTTVRVMASLAVGDMATGFINGFFQGYTKGQTTRWGTWNATAYVFMALAAGGMWFATGRVFKAAEEHGELKAWRSIEAGEQQKEIQAAVLPPSGGRVDMAIRRMDEEMEWS